jgi:frataxin
MMRTFTMKAWRVILFSKNLILKNKSIEIIRGLHANKILVAAPSHNNNYNNEFPFTQSEYLQSIHDTLEHISESIDTMIDSGQLSGFMNSNNAEVEIDSSDGVLHLQLGDVGTFVISRQTPSRQLWLSSPISGPWHYTYDHKMKDWVCTKGGPSFFDRLEKEIGTAIGKNIKFMRLYEQ